VVQLALRPSPGQLEHSGVRAPLREALLRAQVQLREPAHSWLAGQGLSWPLAWEQPSPAVPVLPSVQALVLP